MKIEADIPFELAALVSCGVTTGFCSSIYAADVRPGETVVIFGTGGVGINAVQGARYAGGKNVIAIDPVEFKREQAMELGATHAFAGPEEAQETLINLTRGQLADKVICTVGEMNNDVVKAAVNMTGKAGTVVITGVGYYDMVLPGGILIGYALPDPRPHRHHRGRPARAATPDLMRGILGQALGVPEDAIDLTYPLDPRTAPLDIPASLPPSTHER